VARARRDTQPPGAAADASPEDEPTGGSCGRNNASDAD
jgi:hypothetical protein